MKLEKGAVASDESGTFQKLDAWENRWFPIAAATLQRRHPAVHAQLFKNLKQAEGREVMMTVRTFVDRYDAMKAGQGTYGAEGALAIATLDKRKLTGDVVEEARGLLTKLGDVEASPQGPLMSDAERAAMDKAEADLWAWYREWSAIARQAVTQPHMLQALGLGRRSKKDGEDEEIVVTPVPVPVPVDA